MGTDRYTRRPALLPGYAAALLPRSRTPEVPDRELVLPDLAVRPAHLERYRRVCGFADSDLLPGTYLQVLAFPLSLRLMADPGFPFALPGLVHIRNSVHQLRPIGVDEPLTLRVSAGNLAEHRRGRTIDLLTRVAVGDEPVLTAAATFLRRGPAPAGAPGEREVHADPPPAEMSWVLPARLGRRYAVASGDCNPIHLSRITARLFGYRRPIVHGMWSAARCLAVLGSRLPAAYRMAVHFARPVPLPSRVGFGARLGEHGWEFAVSAPRDGRVLVSGSFAPG